MIQNIPGEFWKQFFITYLPRKEYVFGSGDFWATKLCFSYLSHWPLSAVIVQGVSGQVWMLSQNASFTSLLDKLKRWSGLQFGCSGCFSFRERGGVSVNSEVIWVRGLLGKLERCMERGLEVWYSRGSRWGRHFEG